MQQNSKINFARNILVLTALIAIVALGWLTGHILRFSIPSLGHPPLEESDPQIKTGLEKGGIRRQFVWTGVHGFSGEGAVLSGEFSLAQCLGITFYTSLPAKCRSVDGKWVQVGNSGREFVVTPLEK